MTHIGHKPSQSFLVTALTGILLVSSPISLLARSFQSADPAPAPQRSFPDAPQPQAAQNEQSQAPSTQEPSAPSGAAGAKAATPKGAPVAQPAGAAVAPVRQRGHRSLLIKIGLLAGAGIAVGSAAALSHGSPSRPPGASSSASHQ
jgi:pyruvate/2-oxoglutarate dehydrogenase complex dihydrolipoamide acyltransferase (E2) component